VFQLQASAFGQDILVTETSTQLRPLSLRSHGVLRWRFSILTTFPASSFLALHSAIKSWSGWSPTSLIQDGRTCKIRRMFARFFGRQITAFGLVLGLFLSGVGPSWAAPAVSSPDSMPGMTMTDMAIPAPCTGMGKTIPGKQMPCRDGSMSCAVCTACAINVGAPQGFSPVTLLYHGEVRTASQDVNRTELATPPPLPPPILHA
jgi:hypothetical protein